MQKAQQELQTALNGTSPEVIAAKLKALREVRAKAKDKLKAAQDDLKSVLSVRQEGLLVNLGYLE